MTPAKWPGFYDIAILPPPHVFRQAFGLSAVCHQFGSNWRLGKEERVPHLSLLHIPARSEDLPHLIQRTGHIFSDFALPGSPILRTQGLMIREIHRAVFLMTDKPGWLSELARTLAEELAPLRDERYDLPGRWGALTPRMRENLARYGTPMMDEDFEPHFTLGTFPEGKSPWAEIKRLPVMPLEWEVSALSLCPLGDGFTCFPPIASFEIMKKAPAV